MGAADGAADDLETDPADVGVAGAGDLDAKDLGAKGVEVEVEGAGNIGAADVAVGDLGAGDFGSPNPVTAGTDGVGARVVGVVVVAFGPKLSASGTKLTESFRPRILGLRGVIS